MTYCEVLGGSLRRLDVWSTLVSFGIERLPNRVAYFALSISFSPPILGAFGNLRWLDVLLITVVCYYQLGSWLLMRPTALTDCDRLLARPLPRRRCRFRWTLVISTDHVDLESITHPIRSLRELHNQLATLPSVSSGIVNPQSCVYHLPSPLQVSSPDWRVS